MNEDGYEPRQSKSGEFRAYFKDHLVLAVTLIVGLVTILAAFVGLVLYVGGKASKDSLMKLEKSANKRSKGRLARAISSHEAKNAHHGVAGMIVRYAPSMVQFVHLKARVEQIERRNAEWRRDVKEALREIKTGIKELARQMPRRRRRGRKQ